MKNRVIAVLVSVCLLSFFTLEAESAENELPDQELSRLLSQLRDGDTETRIDAAVALAQMGQIANQAFSSLILALSDDDAQVRATVAYALGQIGVSDRTACSGFG